MVLLIERLPFSTYESRKAALSPCSPKLTRWPSFDLADDMEAGCAHEIIPDALIVPQDEAEPTRRLLMAFSEERDEYTLISEESEPLLIAHRISSSEGAGSSSAGSSFELHIPKDGQVMVHREPAFRLNSLRGVWTLSSQRCNSCTKPATATAGSENGPPALARICHFQNAGTAVTQGTDVRISTPKAGGGSVCGCNSALDKFHLKTAESPKTQVSALETFQLQTAGEHGQVGDISLTFREVSENLFVLKYKHPLTTVQAFGIALSKCK